MKPLNKVKLKIGMEVIYYDGTSIFDRTKVVSVNKSDGTAKLANGVVLNREPIKKGYYKRYKVRSEAKAWLSDEGYAKSVAKSMYEAYVHKALIKKIIPDLIRILDSKSPLVDTDVSWINELYKTVNEFLNV